MARRSVFDPPGTESRWYVVRNLHGAVLESRELPPRGDLKRAFVAAMLEWTDAGWQLGEFSSGAGVFFGTKDGTRLAIEISPTDHGRTLGSVVSRPS